MDPTPPPKDSQIPPGLAAGLDRLERRHTPEWPGDDRVLAASGRRGTRRHPGLIGWSAGLAAAAGLAISALVWLANTSSQAPPATDYAATGPASPATMLDAYRLRLMLDREQTPADAWDANADGRVTGADVETLAASAVRLPEASS